MRKARRDQWLAVGSGMAALLLLVAALPAAGAKPEEKAAASKDTSQYVGSDTCKTCHEDIYKNFETTPHWKTTFNKKGPE